MGLGTIEEIVSVSQGCLKQRGGRIISVSLFSNLPTSCQGLLLLEAIQKPAGEGAWEAWFEDTGSREGEGRSSEPTSQDQLRQNAS